MPDELVISIIDDDASVRAAIEDLVSSLGFSAATFESAEDFLNSPQLDATACIITDVQMPGMKGPELHCHMQSTGRHTPTIFISAFPERRPGAYANGADVLAFLEKPFDAGILVRLLQEKLRSAV